MLLYKITIPKIIVFSITCTVFAISLLFYNKLKLLPFLFIPIILASLLSVIYYDVYRKNALEYCGEPVNIEAVVLKSNYYNNYSSGYDILINKIDGKKVNYKTKLAIEYPCDLSYNEVFTLTVTLSEFDETYGVTGFPMKDYNISKGFILSASTAEHDIYIYSYQRNSFGKFLSDCNEFCSSILRKHLDKDSFTFINAMLLGNTDELSQSFKRDLSYLGLSHIISVSGMHFSILMGALTAILQFFKLDKRLINIIIIIAAVLLMGLTGFSPSVTRSALMFIIYSLSFFIRRPIDSVSSLFISVTLICLFNPNAILDLGLLMSFSATLGILTLGVSANKFIRSKIKSRNIVIRFLKSGINSLIITISAVLFTLPLTWINFGVLSTISPITNLFCSLPLTLILSLSPLVIIFSKLPPLVFLVKITVMFMYTIFDFIVDYFTKIPDLTVSLMYPFMKYVFVILVICFIAVAFISKNPLVYFVPVIVAVIVFSGYLNKYNSSEADIVRTVYVTYNKNDAFIIKYGTRAMICDISDGSYTISNLANQLLKTQYYITEIDTYMFTHYHQRHIATLHSLAEYAYIKNIILPEAISETDISVMNSLTEFAENNGYNVTYYPKSEAATIELFDDIKLQMMEYTKLSRSTHPVLAFSINVNAQKIAYFGNSAFETSNIDYDRADIIIFGQHGPIMKKPIELHGNFNYLQRIIYASDIVKQAVQNPPDTEYEIHNEEQYYSEVAFYVY